METLTDEQLFLEIKNHPKKEILTTKMIKQSGDLPMTYAGQGKQFFTYYYVPQGKYELGRGAFGRVYIAFYDGKKPVKMALKTIQVPTKFEQIKSIEHIISTSRQQILALIKLRRNKHIIKIQDVIRKKHQICILLQYCNDKDLVSFFTNLRQTGLLKSEMQVKYYFNQILIAFKELNQHSFIHRDMKPSNILVKNGVLKIADFGLSKQIFQECESLQEHVGTMITAAPQIVFKEEYSNKCDIYSLGCILYWMLYNRYPFQKPPTKQDFKLEKINFVNPGFPVSEQMKRLIIHMLQYQQERRIDWQNLFSHELFNGNNLNYFHIRDEQNEQKYRNTLTDESEGLHLVDFIQQDDDLLDDAIPRFYYQFLMQIEGQQQFHKYIEKGKKSIDQTPGLESHIKVKQEFKNQNVKIKFLRLILEQLLALDLIGKTQNRNQLALIKKLIFHGIQKYILYLMNRIRQQLVYITPPSIFTIQDLEESEKTTLHKAFVQGVNEKLKSAEFFTGTKLSEMEIKKLKKKSEEFQIYQHVKLLLLQKQLHEGLLEDFISEINNCIIEFIYFIKAWVIKMSKKNLIEKDSVKYKATVLLIHHLFMFSMEKQVFPKKYNPDFNYSVFIEKEKYQSPKEFEEINNKVIAILLKFE